MTRRISLIFAIFQFWIEFSSAQSDTNSITYIENLPIKKGYIYKYSENLSRYQDPATFITIYSPGNGIFSASKGMVKNIRKMGSEFMILVQSNDSIFVYANLDSPMVKENTIVQIGERIGTVSVCKNGIYELTFSIAIEKKRILFLNYLDLYDYLSANFSISRRNNQ